MIEDFLKVAFSTHSYRWTPIGNMEHLKAAAVSELQEFLTSQYYIAEQCGAGDRRRFSAGPGE